MGKSGGMHGSIMRHHALQSEDMLYFGKIYVEIATAIATK